ncbi:MAG: helix-turn-helix domain-containing protein [Polyangiaceae bacterium]
MRAEAPATFADAFEAVRKSLHLTQRRVAELHGVSPRTVERWVLRETTPPLHERIKLLRTLRDAPLPLLETLARVSGTTLDAAGIAPAPHASTPPPPTSLLLHQSIGASAQRVIDDAVRELADELDLTANTIRPGLSRFLGALAGAGAPVDAAARMVLGLPRGSAPGKSGRNGASNGGPRPRN